MLRNGLQAFDGIYDSLFQVSKLDAEDGFGLGIVVFVCGC